MAAPLAIVAAWSLQLAILSAGALLAGATVARRSAPLRQLLWRAVVLLAAASPVLPTMPVRPWVPVTWLLTIASDAGGVNAHAGARDAWPALLLVVLAVGAAARTAWLVYGLRRTATLPCIDCPSGLFEAVSRNIGVSARLVTASVGQPFTYGVRRPTVVIPPDLVHRPEDVQRSVFTHELLHVRRRDGLAQLIEQAFAAITWFHPAAWLIVRELQQAREEIVDCEAAARVGSRRRYLEALLEFAQQPASPRPAPGFLRSRQLARRIAALASEVPMSPLRFAASLAATALLLTATATVANASFPLTAPAARPDDQAASRIEKPIPTKKVNAVYPQDAKEKRIQGNVELDVTVGADGRVKDVSVRKSIPELDAAAIAALRQWEFRPGRVDGKPADAVVTITIAFALK